MNSTILLLLIPLLLLLATYENASMFIVTSQGERIATERGFRIVSYLEQDFQNALELSTKRALALSVDFVVSEKPLDNASKAIKELITYGSYGYISGSTESGVDWKSKTKQFMGNSTIKDWILNMKRELKKQGYEIVTPTEEIMDNTNVVVAPLDSFHIVVKANITHITIRDVSGDVVYSGPFPRRGSVYAIVSIEGTEDPLYPVLTGHRLSRIVSACRYAFPMITPPYKVLSGDSVNPGTLSSFSAPLRPSPQSNSIYYGKTYTEDSNVLGYVIENSCPSNPNAPVVCNTTLGGIKVSPTSVFASGDMGIVILTSESQGQTTTWCNPEMEKRVNFTITNYQPNELTLLVLDANSIPFADAAHNGPSASIRIYKKDSCELAPYWIEYWGDKVLIWLNTTDTAEYSLYFSSNPAYESQGDISVFPRYWPNVAITAGLQVEKALGNIPWSSFYVRYQMRGDSNTDDLNAGIGLGWNSSQGDGDITVNITYSEYIPGVYSIQVPIYLNSTIARSVDHTADNKARIRVEDSYGNPVHFWIEYWNNSGALVWVKVPWDAWSMSYRLDFKIKPNSGAYTRGNGDEVFPFFDDFNETLSKWEVDPYGQGATVTLDSANSVVKIDGGDYLFSMRNWYPLGINYHFAIRFRMKPTFSRARNWNAGIGIWDSSYRPSRSGELYEQLFTDNLKVNHALSIHWAEWRWTGWGWVLQNFWAREDSLSIPRKSYEFETYEVTEVFGGTVEFRDLSDGRSIVYSKTPESIYRPLNYVYLVINSGKFSRGALFDWIFVRTLLNKNKLSVQVSRGARTTPDSIQFIDNGQFAPSNNHLAIIHNWSSKLAEYGSGSWDITHSQRYEVRITPSEVSFTHEPNVDPVSTSTLFGVGNTPTLYAVINNSMDNNAHFDWIVAYSSYVEGDVAFSTVEDKPEGVQSQKSRVYDIQPFIDCVENNKYFGVSGAPSFLERLEGGSDTNRAYYERLSQEIQREMYGEVKYPIGLVSFILPSRLPPNLYFLIRKQSAADYIYLNYNDYPMDDPNAMKVLGISTNGGVSSPLIDEKFYLTEYTSNLIFSERMTKDILR